MEKEQIAFVVQRYGLEVNGGAEYHCRVLAEHLLERYHVDVLTSCARDYMPWDNYYDAGTSMINGVKLYRFPVEKVKDEHRLAVLAKKLDQGETGAEEEWIKEIGPYCPGLIHYIKNNADRYKAILFFGYAFYPTVIGLQQELENTILIPTAHDEPTIYKKICSNVFQRANAILYNSIEEKKFIIDKFHTEDKPSRLTCVGIHMPDLQDCDMPEGYESYQHYVIYVGRVCRGKNFSQLSRYFIKYKQEHPSDLKLFVIGRINNEEQMIYHEDIIHLGFVSEEHKVLFMKNAQLLIMPSLYESLSLVILESMASGRPVLVNGDCEVLKGQCIRSNAGLYYTSYAEFEKMMHYMLTNTRAYEQMAHNGLEFVKNAYSWEFVVENVSSLIQEAFSDRRL